MLGAVARFVIRRRAVVLALYAVLVPFALFHASSVLPMLEAGGFEDPTRESWKTFELMQAEFGAGTGDVIALYTTSAGVIEDPPVVAAIEAVISRLEKDPRVGATESFYATGRAHLVSSDRTRTIVVVDLLGSEQEKIAAFRRLRADFDADGLSVQFGGLIPTNIAIFETIRADLTRAELLAFPLTALVVFLVFGSPAAVVILLAAAGCGIVFAFAALRAVVAFEDVSIFAANTITLLGFGLTVDYSLFVVTRFREELPSIGVHEAIVRTVETTGRTVVFSGVTVAASLCGLFVFDQMFLRSLGLGGIVVVFGTVLLTLTLTPALLSLAGERLDRWRITRPAPEQEGIPERSLWYRIAVMVMRRPLIVAVLTIALLLSLALPFARFDGTIVDWRALPPGDPVRTTNEIIESEFLPNQNTPHLVLVTVPGDSLDGTNVSQLMELSERMWAIPGVARVDDVFSMLGSVSGDEPMESLLEAARSDPSYEPLISSFTKGPWMRFSLLSEKPFNDPVSLDQVHALRAMSDADMRVQVAGYSAALVDLRTTIREGAPRMVLLVVALMFVALLLAFGSVTLPLKAVVMNALSLTASFGAIVWIFQDGRLQHLLDYTPLGFSDITLPLVMFAIVFGISMDYEVLLLSRVREEYARSRDNSRAIALGLARTGRLITSAGAVLVVVVAAFSTSQMLFLKALGVGMALAIILDITVVRALLVPATMRLMGRWNWYAPGPLGRLGKGSASGDPE